MQSCYSWMLLQTPRAGKKVGWEMFLQIREVCKTARTLIMGDFNYSAIDWDSHDAEVKQRNGFPEVMQDCHLTRLAEQPSLHRMRLFRS